MGDNCGSFQYSVSKFINKNYQSSMMADSPSNIIVFISYSQDSPNHNKRVLDLANKLCEDGIDVQLDQYVTSPPEGWPRWMEQQIEKADFILVVCTKIYLEKINGNKEYNGKGLGVKWESLLTYQDIYYNDSLNSRFIPIFFNDSSSEYIPKAIKSVTHYQIDTDYDALYGHLTNQPAIKKPPLGKIKKLLSDNRNQKVNDKKSKEELVKKVDCGLCGGAGRETPLSMNLCPVCHGKGKIKISYSNDSKLVTCGLCRGAGRETPLSMNLCPVCHGIGINVVSKSAEKCSVCSGTGREFLLSMNLCPGCDGTGYGDD